MSGAAERGSALVVTMLVVLIVTALGATLVLVPKLNFDRQLLSEDREQAIGSADAAVRDALVGLQSGTVTAAMMPYSAGSAASPVAFAADVAGRPHGYYYSIAATGSAYIVEATGIQSTASGGTPTVTARVEAVILSGSGTPGFPGAVGVYGSASTVHVQLKETNSGGVVGADAAGTGTTVSGVGIDSSMTASVAFTGSQSHLTGTGSLGGVAGASQSDLAPTYDPLFAALDAVTGGTVYSGGAANQQYTMAGAIAPGSASPVYFPTGVKSNNASNVGSAATPAIVVIRPVSTATLSNTLFEFTSTGQVYGIVYIDLSSPSLVSGGTVTLGKDLVKVTNGTSVNGIIAVKGPAVPLVFSNTNVLNMTNVGGNGGAVVVKLQNTVSTSSGSTDNNLPLLLDNGTANLQYNSATVGAAWGALGLSGSWSIASYRIVE